MYASHTKKKISLQYYNNLRHIFQGLSITTTTTTKDSYCSQIERRNCIESLHRTNAPRSLSVKKKCYFRWICAPDERADGILGIFIWLSVATMLRAQQTADFNRAFQTYRKKSAWSMWDFSYFRHIFFFHSYVSIGNPLRWFIVCLLRLNLSANFHSTEEGIRIEIGWFWGVFADFSFASWRTLPM